MTAIVNGKGEVQVILTGPEDFIAANTPEGCYAVDDPPNQNMIYVEGVWLDQGERPTPFHKFDADSFTWVDERNLDQVKNDCWIRIKNLYGIKERSGILFEGNLFDSDQLSQQRIILMATVDGDMEWVTADNLTVTLSRPQREALRDALSQFILALHNEKQLVRNQIYSSSTLAELDTIMAESN